MYDYHQLEALEAIVTHGNFVRAAKVLRVSQSAVSQRIRALEEYCGAPLLALRNPPELTTRGRELVQHVRKVKLLEFELEGSESPDAERPLLSVRIGVNADSLATWLFGALAPLARSERLLFDLIVENEELSYRLLERGEVLGCISARSRAVPGGELTALGRMEYICVATPEFRERYFPKGLDREGVARAPAVLFDMKDQVHERFVKRVLQLRSLTFPHHSVPTSQGFVAAIVHGMAYGVAPRPQIEAAMKRRELRDLAPGQRLDIPLYWHYPRRESRLQKSLRAGLVAAAKRSLAS